jgi:hypothetical protein
MHVNKTQQESMRFNENRCWRRSSRGAVPLDGVDDSGVFLGIGELGDVSSVPDRLFRVRQHQSPGVDQLVEMFGVRLILTECPKQFRFAALKAGLARAGRDFGLVGQAVQVGATTPPGAIGSTLPGSRTMMRR